MLIDEGFVLFIRHYAPSLHSLFLSDCCLSCCQTCNRYTEWRAGYIVKTNLVAELNRRWVTTVLTTNTAVKFAVYRFSKFQSCFHQLANTFLVKFSKWIVLEDFSIIVCIQELTSIITGETECHLSQIVCSEAEEVSLFSDFVSSQCCTRNLDHSTNLILKVYTCCCDFSICCLNNNFLNVF